MPRLLTTLCLVIIPAFAHGQTYDHDIHLQVLEKGIVDSVFVFGKWDTIAYAEETHLWCLGQLATTNGKTFKIMNSSRFWGWSRRATNRVLVFDAENKLVGYYGMTMIYDLPSKLIEGRLIFTNTLKEGCDKSLTTEIDLKQGFPEAIFIRCNEKYGDHSFFSSP